MRKKTIAVLIAVMLSASSACGGSGSSTTSGSADGKPRSGSHAGGNSNLKQDPVPHALQDTADPCDVLSKSHLDSEYEPGVFEQDQANSNSETSDPFLQRTCAYNVSVTALGYRPDGGTATAQLKVTTWVDNHAGGKWAQLEEDAKAAHAHSAPSSRAVDPFGHGAYMTGETSIRAHAGRVVVELVGYNDKYGVFNPDAIISTMSGLMARLDQDPSINW